MQTLAQRVVDQISVIFKRGVFVCRRKLARLGSFRLAFQRQILIAARRFLDLLGLRFIWQKLSPPSNQVVNDKNYRPPSSIVIWVTGIWVAFFGFSEGLHQSAMAQVQFRLSTLVSLLNEDSRAWALSELATLQHVKIPRKPYLPNGLGSDEIGGSLVSPFLSIVHRQTSSSVVDEIKAIVESQKAYLTGVDLGSIDLSGADLSGGNLQHAILDGANLSDANLSQADLRAASLVGANLTRANFYDAMAENLMARDAVVHETNFKYANLDSAYFTSAKVCNADFLFSDGVSVDFVNAIYCDKESNLSVLEMYGICTEFSSEDVPKHCNLPPLLFELDTSIIRRRDEWKLERLSQLLYAAPSIKVAISAHTHQLGTEEYNQALGSRLADSTGDFLHHKYGVSISRLRLISYGESRSGPFLSVMKAEHAGGLVTMSWN